MHPPRPNGAIERPKLADRFADWIVTHCPLSALTLLTVLVTSSLGLPRPWQVFATVVAADLLINGVRWSRRRWKRQGHATPVRPGVTA